MLIVRVAALLTFLSGAGLTLYADVIYLNNGSVLLVRKAWEEGDQVKYETSKGIQSLPKSAVRSVRHEAAPAPSTAVKAWGRLSDGDSQGGGNWSPAAPNSAATSPGAAVSREALARLRNNLNAAPADAAAKAELVRALNSVASLQVSQGDLASAKASLEEAIKLERNNSVLLSNLATVCFRLGDYQRTEDLLTASLAVDRKNAWTHYLLGEAYYRQEKIAQAISEWTQGLDLNPDPAIAQRLDKARREAGVHDELTPIRSTHFILRYDTRTTFTPLGRQILDALEEQYRRLSGELTPQGPATVAVILYPTQAYFDVTRAPGWAGGTYDGKIRIPTKGLWSVTQELKAVLAHELTHCFMTALPGRGTPTWFLEGVAQIEEGRAVASDRSFLQQLQKEKQLIPLRNLRDSFSGLAASTAAIAYAESLSAVEYLVARSGRSAIRSVLDLMAQNYNFENAFSTAIQKPVPEFETAWERDLK